MGTYKQNKSWIFRIVSMSIIQNSRDPTNLYVVMRKYMFHSLWWWFWTDLRRIIMPSLFTHKSALSYIIFYYMKLNLHFYH